MTSLFKIAPNLRVDLLSSVPKCKKAVMCFMEKTTFFLDKLHAGPSYSAVGHELVFLHLVSFPIWSLGEPFLVLLGHDGKSRCCQAS